MTRMKPGLSLYFLPSTFQSFTAVRFRAKQKTRKRRRRRSMPVPDDQTQSLIQGGTTMSS